jgi:hypothetical protein
MDILYAISFGVGKVGMVLVFCFIVVSPIFRSPLLAPLERSSALKIYTMKIKIPA